MTHLTHLQLTGQALCLRRRETSWHIRAHGRHVHCRILHPCTGHHMDPQHATRQTMPFWTCLAGRPSDK